MKVIPQRALRLFSVAYCLTASHAMAAACNPAWNSATAYTGGAVASYASVNYLANWWTQGNNPATNNGGAGSGEPWTSQGACASGATPTPTPTKTPTPTPVPTPTPTKTPTPTPTPTPIPASGFTAGGTYTLINQGTGMALDVVASGTANSTAVDVYTINGTVAQNWQINSNSDGSYTLVNPNSGKALDVVASGTANGTKLDIYTTSYGVSQKWNINSNGDGTYTLINPNSGRALDVVASGQINGTLVDIYDSNGTGAQKWKIMVPTKPNMFAYIQNLSGHGIMGGLERDHNSSIENTVISDEGGKTLGYFGGDFGFGAAASPSSRAALMQQLIQQYQAGAIVHLIYHACIPTQAVSNADEQNCYWGSGGGVSPSSLTDAQWSDLITSGGYLNGIWKKRLDIIAPYFKTLQDAGVQVIFRPFHELNQGAFWWGGRSGSQGSAALFQLTEDYIKNTYGYSNIVWEWDIQDLTAPSTFASYAPAASYYSIAALDMYNSGTNSGYTTANYNAMLAIAGSKPIAIGESFVVPSAATIAAQPKWVYFEGWPDADFLSDNTSAQIQTFYDAAVQPLAGF